tara:strand:- start:773 stop:1174 length:402 start_codon:yes stop_codon:yes gene_type:complete
MGKNKSLSNKKINWLNYQSNVKNILIRLDTNKQMAAVIIDIQHKDEEVRYLFYEQFIELKTVFNSICGDHWQWIKESKNEAGNDCSRITTTISNVNIFEKSSWPKIFNFYEKNLINLDSFWNEFSDLFKALED